jgi:hypothetical protein
MSAGTHIHGTHVPVEEPSTASKADIRRVGYRETYIPQPTEAEPTGLDVADLLKSYLCDFASIAERAGNVGVSYFAQIPDGQRRK